jgi:hypothetical protein
MRGESSQSDVARLHPGWGHLLVDILVTDADAARLVSAPRGPGCRRYLQRPQDDGAASAPT